MHARLDHRAKAEAAYAFKGERPATFDTFTILIRGTRGSGNVQEFEWLVGNDSPTGAFEPIGKFQTQNVKLFKTPCHEFEFPAMTAEVLRVLTTFTPLQALPRWASGSWPGRPDRLNFILAVVLSLPWTLLSGYVANDVTRFGLVILTMTPIPWFDRSFLF